jgi:putative transposase
MTSSKLPRDGVRRRRPRLREFNYVGPYRYFLTICTYENRPLFTDRWPYAEIVVILSQAAAKLGFDVLAYTFMPDHFHLLVEGREGGDLREFVRLFKSRSSYSYKRLTGVPLWQSSYYDRVLRKDEDSLKVAEYIINNPVRRGLVSDALQYPYSGSFVCPLSEVV